jgi:hypothetical protein
MIPRRRISGGGRQPEIVEWTSCDECNGLPAPGERSSAARSRRMRWVRAVSALDMGTGLIALGWLAVPRLPGLLFPVLGQEVDLPNIDAQPEPAEAFNVNVQALVYAVDTGAPPSYLI